MIHPSPISVTRRSVSTASSTARYDERPAAICSARARRSPNPSSTAIRMIDSTRFSAKGVTMLDGTKVESVASRSIFLLA